MENEIAGAVAAMGFFYPFTLRWVKSILKEDYSNRSNLSAIVGMIALALFTLGPPIVGGVITHSLEMEGFDGMGYLGLFGVGVCYLAAGVNKLKKIVRKF